MSDRIKVFFRGSGLPETRPTLEGWDLDEANSVYSYCALGVGDPHFSSLFDNVLVEGESITELELTDSVRDVIVEEWNEYKKLFDYMEKTRNCPIPYVTASMMRRVGRSTDGYFDCDGIAVRERDVARISRILNVPDAWDSQLIHKVERRDPFPYVASYLDEDEEVDEEYEEERRAIPLTAEQVKRLGDTRVALWSMIENVYFSKRDKIYPAARILYEIYIYSGLSGGAALVLRSLLAYTLWRALVSTRVGDELLLLSAIDWRMLAGLLEQAGLSGTIPCNTATTLCGDGDLRSITISADFLNQLDLSQGTRPLKINELDAAFLYDASLAMFNYHKDPVLLGLGSLMPSSVRMPSSDVFLEYANGFTDIVATQNERALSMLGKFLYYYMEQYNHTTLTPSLARYAARIFYSEIGMHGCFSALETLRASKSANDPIVATFCKTLEEAIQGSPRVRVRIEDLIRMALGVMKP